MNAMHWVTSAAAASTLLLSGAPDAEDEPESDTAQGSAATSSADRGATTAAADATAEVLDRIRQRLRQDLDARLATRPRLPSAQQQLSPGLVIAPQDGMPIVVPDASGLNMPVIVPDRTEPMPTVKPEAPYIPGTRLTHPDTVRVLLRGAADSLITGGAADLPGEDDEAADDTATGGAGAAER